MTKEKSEKPNPYFINISDMEKLKPRFNIHNPWNITPISPWAGVAVVTSYRMQDPPMYRLSSPSVKEYKIAPHDEHRISCGPRLEIPQIPTFRVTVDGVRTKKIVVDDLDYYITLGSIQGQEFITDKTTENLNFEVDLNHIVFDLVNSKEGISYLRIKSLEGQLYYIKLKNYTESLDLFIKK